MPEAKDIRLVIEIKNNQPIELIDLTKSLVALGTQFNSYVQKNGDSKENREAKLYVKEIKTGSVILELIEIATIGMLPFLENVNTIVGFGQYCKATFDYFLKNEGEKPELLPSDYSELSSIVNPVANDNGSQFNMSTTVNGNVELHLHLGSTEANAFQNIAKKEYEKLKQPEQSDEIKHKVLMTWFQARSNLKSKVGNKVLIEEISDKPVNIVFDISDDLKEKMLHSDINPLKTAYVVDVKIQTVQGKPFAYKVVKLHEWFDLEE